MSRQLAISAAFCTFAMAAFVLWATPQSTSQPTRQPTWALAGMQTGATVEAATPALDRIAPALFTTLR